MKRDLHIVLDKEIKTMAVVFAMKEDCSISEFISRAIQAYKIFLDGKEANNGVELKEQAKLKSVEKATLKREQALRKQGSQKERRKWHKESLKK